MTGLVNAAGTPEPSRVQTAYRTSERARQAELEKNVPIVTGLQATERILQAAVETIKFAGADTQRAVPNGEQSDRFDQADQESHAAGTLGRNLDVTA